MIFCLGWGYFAIKESKNCQDLDTSAEMETRTAAVAQLECDSPYSTIHGSDEETLRFWLNSKFFLLSLT